MVLLETFDGYAVSQGIKPGTRRNWRKMIDRLVEFIGHDDAVRLTEDDLLGWRDQLLSETLKDGSTRNPRTVRGSYIPAVRATLEWAVEQRKLPANADVTQNDGIWTLRITP